jgi:hypothetical protein
MFVAGKPMASTRLRYNHQSEDVAGEQNLVAISAGLEITSLERRPIRSRSLDDPSTGQPMIQTREATEM